MCSCIDNDVIPLTAEFDLLAYSATHYAKPCLSLSQCSDISVCPDEAEPQRIGFKGIITLPKPVQFKSSVKECRQVANVFTYNTKRFLIRSLKSLHLHYLCLSHSGCFLHGDLRVHAAPPAVALQRSGAAPADAQPQEADCSRVRPVAASARLSGDGALVGAQPTVQIISELL